MFTDAALWLTCPGHTPLNRCSHRPNLLPYSRQKTAKNYAKNCF